MRYRSSLLSTCAVLASLHFASAASLAATPQTPRLVVVVSVDQFAYEYLERFRAGFDPHGIINRFRHDGAWFTNCHHRHGITTTGPGHSVQLTGAYPESSGIVDNDWFDRATGKDVYCVADPQAKIVGPDDGRAPVSPRNLLVDTLGDRLKIVTDGRSKVFGVGAKDRAAILLAGHAADGAFFLNSRCQWITSDFYRDELPAYLRSWNNSDALARYSGKTWDLLYERGRYQHPAKEDSFGERPSKSTVDFPHKMHAIGSRDFYHDLLESPFGSEITLEAARLIIADEQLGMDEFPDVLGINITPNDYVGHAYGPESLEVEDITYRTDRLLGEFADFVNDRLEGRPWILVVTADHGVTPIPELAARWKLAGRRNPLVVDSGNRPGPASQMLEAYLRRALGVSQAEPTLVQAFTDIQVYLRRDHPALQGERFVEAQRATRDWLLSQDCVAVAVTREQCLSGGATGRTEAMLRRSFHPRRSGDVLFALEPYNIEGRIPAMHGEPWECDTHVPLLMIGFGNASPDSRLIPGLYNRRVSPASIAPTLAWLLHITPPAGCVEEPLLEVLPQGSHAPEVYPTTAKAHAVPTSERRGK
jgi:predicted AlkP superfamily pyrophosphatase or phosphodiesterase